MIDGSEGALFLGVIAESSGADKKGIVWDRLALELIGPVKVGLAFARSHRERPKTELVRWRLRCVLKFLEPKPGLPNFEILVKYRNGHYFCVIAKVYHFHIKQNTFQFELGVFLNKLDAFEIKLNILQIRTNVLHIKLETPKNMNYSFNQERFRITFLEMF